MSLLAAVSADPSATAQTVQSLVGLAVCGFSARRGYVRAEAVLSDTGRLPRGWNPTTWSALCFASLLVGHVWLSVAAGKARVAAPEPRLLEEPAPDRFSWSGVERRPDLPPLVDRSQLPAQHSPVPQPVRQPVPQPTVVSAPPPVFSMTPKPWSPAPPVVEAPTPQAPVVEEPAPVVVAPAVEAPAVEAPAVEAPVAEAPVVEEPAAAPVVPVAPAVPRVAAMDVLPAPSGRKRR